MPSEASASAFAEAKASGSGYAEAAAKAEMLRARIEAISDAHGMRVTASLGVATIPETSKNAGDLLTAADGALYRAKQGGRGRIVIDLPDA